MAQDDWKPNYGGIGVDAPTWAAKRPLRIALLGDFGAGALNGRLDDSAALAKRKPLKVEFDTIEDALARLKLKLTLPIGADGSPLEVPISELESFHPDELYRHVEVFSTLAGLRKRLNTPATFAKAAAEVQAMGGGAPVPRASAVSRHAQGHGGELDITAKLDDFARLTGRPSSAAAAAVEKKPAGLDALLRDIVGPFVVPAPNPQKDALLKTVDSALSDAMRAVLHQPDFQNAESLWRGVDFLLRRLETSHQLQVHLFDIGAEEFAADLSAAADLSDSALYKLLVETPSQDPDGGYGYICGLYHFDATPPQTELLGRAALVAAHAGAPFITAITTDPFTDRREPPHRLVKQAFTALRELPDASYLGLIGPRFLLRQPYGKKSEPIQSFAFEEVTPAAGLRGMLWGHPALLALCVLAVRGGTLAINDLPFHHFVDADGDSVALPCTERLINTQASALLRDFGINAVMAYKGQPVVRLAGLEALNGDGLAAPGGMSRKPASDSRFMLRSKPDGDAAPAADAWAPGERKATGGSAKTAAAGAADDVDDDATAGAAADTPASTEASPADADAAAAAAAATDAELDALLAGLTSDAEPAAADPEPSPPVAEEEASADSELDALLASLSGDAQPAPTPASEEEEMDPELAALLKSLG